MFLKKKIMLKIVFKWLDDTFGEEKTVKIIDAMMLVLFHVMLVLMAAALVSAIMGMYYSAKIGFDIGGMLFSAMIVYFLKDFAKNISDFHEKRKDFWKMWDLYEEIRSVIA